MDPSESDDNYDLNDVTPVKYINRNLKSFLPEVENQLEDSKKNVEIRQQLNDLKNRLDHHDDSIQDNTTQIEELSVTINVHEAKINTAFEAFETRVGHLENLLQAKNERGGGYKKTRKMKKKRTKRKTRK